MAKATLNCQNLKNVLASIKSAIGNETDNVSLVFDKKKGLTAYAQSSKLTLAMKVAECSGDGKCTVDIDSFIKIIGNRQTMELEIKSGKIRFKAGKYEGSLVTKPFQDIKFEERKNDKLLDIKRDSGLANSLNTARKYLALSNIAKRDAPLILNVVVRGGRMTCMVSDHYHFASYECKVAVEDDIGFNIHDETLRKILSLTKAENEYDLVIEKARIIVKTENIEATMAMLQVEMQQVDLVIKTINAKKDTIKASVVVSSDTITDPVDSMMAIFEPDKAISLTLGKEMSLDYKTSYGSISESTSVKLTGKSKTIKISPELLEDTTSNLPSDDGLRVSISEEKRNSNVNRFLIIESENLGLVYVVTQTS